jgi:methionyl-tRNA formyltransferase
MSRIVVLGGGESGVGSAILAKVKGFDVFLSDMGRISEDYAAMLAQNGLEHAEPGTVLSDGKTYLAVATADGAVSITELQLSGKKRMAVKDFLIGFREPQTYTTSKGTSSNITGHHA